jgi:gamma-glutamyl-gamma-aminobutyrate hydrolase PuuD
MNKQEILNLLNQHIKACSEASLDDAVMAFHEAIKLVEQLDENEREAIMDAYDAGLFDGSMDDVDNRMYYNSKQYYNETFNTKEK